MTPRDVPTKDERKPYTPPVLEPLSEETPERVALASVGTQSKCIAGSCTGISGCC